MGLYKITEDGINQVKAYQDAIHTVEGFLEQNAVNELNELLDCKEPLVKALRDLFGCLGRDIIFNYIPEGVVPPYREKDLEFDTDGHILREEYGPDDLTIGSEGNLIERFLSLDWIEELEDEEDECMPWLEIIHNNMGKNENLFDAIASTLEGIRDESEIESVRDEIVKSELFTKAEQRTLMWIIDDYHKHRVASVKAITLTLKQTFS